MFLFEKMCYFVSNLFIKQHNVEEYYTNSGSCTRYFRELRSKAWNYHRKSIIKLMIYFGGMVNLKNLEQLDTLTILLESGSIHLSCRGLGSTLEQTHGARGGDSFTATVIHTRVYSTRGGAPKITRVNARSSRREERWRRRNNSLPLISL